MVHLHRKSNSGIEGLYKKFCSIYVQLSRLQTLDEVQLLQPITLEDIGNKPNPKLQKESLKLNDILDQTLSQ